MAQALFGATVGVSLLLGISAAAQEPALESAPKPAPENIVVQVATLDASTRAPSEKEVEELGLRFEVRARGQIVTEVAPDGVAARAGVEPGDVLVKLDANEVYGQDDIADFLRVSKPGQKVDAVVLRGKTRKEETVAVALGTREEEAPESPRLEWQFAGLGQLDDALARAKKEDKLVLVGLSGAET